MREVAPGVWQLAGLVPHLINTYLIRIDNGEALIDAGTRWAAGRVLRQLRGRPLSLVALTHVHPDHQGSAAQVCANFRVPLACHEADVDVMEGRAPMAPRNAIVRLGGRLLTGPTHPVAVRWRGGEMLGEFRVIHAPGHTPGHVIFFREADGVALAGDVVHNIAPLLGLGHRLEPPPFFSVDPAQNRESMKLLVRLRPSLVLCGHGPPMHHLAALERYVARLSSGPGRPADAARGA